MKFKMFLVFLFITSFFLTKANAQCPTTIDPLYVPWINQGCVTMMVDFGGGIICEAEVCYCWRQIGVTAPFIEVFVYSVTPTNPNCIPPHLNYRDILKYAGISVISKNPNNLNWPCPPCPNEATEYNLYIGACMNNQQYCPDGLAYCRMIYSVCCDPYTGVRQSVHLGNYLVGDLCNGACKATCP